MKYVPDITAFDYIIALCYILILAFIAFAYQKNKSEQENDPNYEYFMRAFWVKIGGGAGFLFLTVYFWGGGDTYSYYNTARDFLRFAMIDPEEGLRVFLASVDNMNWYKYEFAFNRHNFLRTTPNFTTVKITALVNAISFNSYVISTVVFSALSFLGVWNMYYLFCKIYPHLRSQLFYGFFFIPTVIMWGSGILKDTVTLASMSWIIYSFINIVILKRKKFKSIVIIVIATITITLIKPYILYVLYPCLFIWVQGNLKQFIKSTLIRRLIAPFIALVLIVSSFFLAQELSEQAGRYNLENMENTMEGFRTWHTNVSETKHQSGYTLGDMDFSPTGILKKIPSALVATFFRPYLWEITNPSTALGGVEGFILLCISIWMVLKFRLKLFRLIFQNNDILFLLLFALIFGAVVGLTSYNFGALSRYKIPAQMFYVIALILIADKTDLIKRR